VRRHALKAGTLAGSGEALLDVADTLTVVVQNIA
jgi:hypothetical protein